MHSTSLLVAAFAAVAAATPLGSITNSSTSATFTLIAGSSTTSFVSAAPTKAGSVSTSYLLGNPSASPNPKPTAGTVGKLLTEDTRVARFKEIAAEVEAGTLSLKFDFNPAANPLAANTTAPDGGVVDLANRANFPILTGLGISAAGIFFQPCGLNTPHIHPDATEFLTLAVGNNVTTGFVLENGFTTEQKTSLQQFQGTVFPMGSIHWQQNNECTPAVAIAGLNSEDPGASSIAQNFLINTSGDIIDATLGFPKQIDANNFAQFKSQIPASLALGVQECLTRCNIAH